MSEEAAKQLFKLLSGGIPTSDEFARDYNEDFSYERFWSSHSDHTILELLTELCQYFGIDAVKFSAFLASIADCDYCGQHTSKVQKMPDGEYVCEECLKKFEKGQPH